LRPEYLIFSILQTRKTAFTDVFTVRQINKYLKNLLKKPRKYGKKAAEETADKKFSFTNMKNVI